MMPFRWPRIAFALALLLLGAAPLLAQEGLLAGPALVAELQRGGYVLMFRHAATDWSSRDESRSTLDDCSTQRNLTEEGRTDARRIGEAVRALRIPIGAVWASPFCRTRETAQLAFGQAELTRDLLWPGSSASEEAMAKHKAAVRTRLGTLPPAGRNTVLVTHGFVIHGVTEQNVAEGEALVLRPAGGQRFQLVGRLLPGDWSAVPRPAG